jgi:uncharacterized repeat protein (TIGR03803 family)
MKSMFSIYPHRALARSATRATSTQHGGSISRMISRVASAALALALVLLLSVVANHTAQAQTFGLLYSFANGTDGGYPYSTLIQDASGNLYGTTYYGGAYTYGAAFELSTGPETVLHSFGNGMGDGSSPFAGLVRDKSGNFYGTTYSGGASGYGTVFMLDATGKETILHSFVGGADGKSPIYGSLVRDGSGNLYGTTKLGGTSGVGTVFKVTKTGKETVLYSFTNGLDGGYPFGGLVRDTSGNVYGTTYSGGASSVGTVFKVTKTGTETVLYSFAGGAEGEYPYAGMVRDSSGNLYGTTSEGGASNVETVFKVTPTGQETVLYSFAGGTDGANPFAGLVRDRKGNLYGTTEAGGASGVGTVFKLSATGQETVLHTFTGATTDGANPFGGLVRDATGKLYGTTFVGGAFGHGAVYEINP